MITGGGRILHIPDFSAIGRILAIYPSGSANSSHDGSNTGHSGGGTNSSPPSIALKTNKQFKKTKCVSSQKSNTTPSKSKANRITLVFNTSRMNFCIKHSFIILAVTHLTECDPLHGFTNPEIILIMRYPLFLFTVF